ncbi:hypothetical protein BO70DRAFT_393484 [Aspergillus heteromorphus CBS 117.55]|uniref:Uncharacterized protein n=1 Tax=Aspergillus heteromorphus CBS 117.55 TaxID=1448321 RepID=A0A317WR28_9EURO|nr:uncharacterized protein BO70DRAFT_393484 [Aspergillus heteromorphus CBS 117.55]PWY88964.1 hypothetical protein BO70DRAFT_393484 [Aspergillus heteromorphus CBS 117.55]
MPLSDFPSLTTIMTLAVSRIGTGKGYSAPQGSEVQVFDTRTTLYESGGWHELEWVSPEMRHRMFRVWKKHLQGGDNAEDAWLGLLLLRVTNLLRLSLPFQDERCNFPYNLEQTPYFDRVIEWAGDRKLKILAHLTHVSIKPAPWRVE